MKSPSPLALQHSQRLTHHIATAIQKAGGQIPFSEYMQLALYAPTLGYYDAGASKFGQEGDFITAPELSPLFGQCLAEALSPVFQAFSHNGIILELGAGTGKLAAILLEACPDIKQYFILEVSANLQKRQQEILKPHLSKVVWLDKLPKTPINGVILANEVMDALPITRFCYKNNQVYEYFVQWKNNAFCWHLDIPCNKTLTDFVMSLSLPENYTSEYQSLLTPWIQSLSDILAKGLMLLIDYGFPRHEYYHPDRNMGTLMCHYQHKAHANPFYLPGLQDITAHIDFTHVAESAHSAKLSVAGFTTQEAFLLDCGILDKAKTLTDKNHLKILTLPNEMGDLFKVMALTRDLENPLRGFCLQDHRFRL